MTFEKGSQLKTIQGGASSLYYGAFFGCTSLTSIEIPASVETIGSTAFRGCTALTTVTFEKGSQLKTIRGGRDRFTYYYGAFYGLPNLKTVDMSACTQVEEIGDSAFANCSSLQLFKIGTVDPPHTSGGEFSGLPSYSVLKVPAGTENQYRTLAGWGSFSNISAL